MKVTGIMESCVGWSISLSTLIRNVSFEILTHRLLQQLLSLFQ